jgi:hypothetical protein
VYVLHIYRLERNFSNSCDFFANKGVALRNPNPAVRRSVKWLPSNWPRCEGRWRRQMCETDKTWQQSVEFITEVHTCPSPASSRRSQTVRMRRLKFDRRKSRPPSPSICWHSIQTKFCQKCFSRLPWLLERDGNRTLMGATRYSEPSAQREVRALAFRFAASHGSKKVLQRKGNTDGTLVSCSRASGSSSFFVKYKLYISEQTVHFITQCHYLYVPY